MVVHPVVARDGDLVEGGLLAFDDLDQQVDRVGGDHDLLCFDVRAQVAVVLVQRRHRFIHRIDPGTDPEHLVHRLAVVDVAGLDRQDPVQHLRVVDAVAHPGDVAVIEEVALLQLQIDPHPVVADRVDRVGQDPGVPVSFRVVEFDQAEFVLVELFLTEPRTGEDVDAFLVRLHRPPQPTVGEDVVAFEVDAADLHPGALVDPESDVDHVLPRGVVLREQGHLGVQKAFVFEVTLDAQDRIADPDVG